MRCWPGWRGRSEAERCDVSTGALSAAIVGDGRHTATPISPHAGTRGTLRFVFSVAVSHVVTYVLAGLIASRVLDYPSIFEQPVIRDYYHPYASVDVVWSAGLQVVRGVLFGLVLLPLRGFLAATRWGWLWLWLVFVTIGIIGTPAASPGSLEGVIYTRMPQWFHAIGMPEMMLQTLVFSFLVHRTLRAAEHPLPQHLTRLLNAVAVACISFIGYTVVSLGFAFSAGVGLASGSDLRVLGQFIAPLVLTFAAVLVPGDRWWLPKHALLYLVSAGAFAAYQAAVLGSAGWLYVLIAPVLPVLISLAMTRPGGAAQVARSSAAKVPRPGFPRCGGMGWRGHRGVADGVECELDCLSVVVPTAANRGVA